MGGSAPLVKPEGHFDFLVSTQLRTAGEMCGQRELTIVGFVHSRILPYNLHRK